MESKGTKNGRREDIMWRSEDIKAKLENKLAAQTLGLRILLLRHVEREEEKEKGGRGELGRRRISGF